MSAPDLDVAAYATALGDDALVLAQRCGQWITRAPQLEEDVALANIGLDLLGQARALYDHATRVEGAGRTEDDLAYLRDAPEFRNALLVELANGDFAVTVARLLTFGTHQLGLYRALAASRDETLAAIAAKAVKEVDYHVDHASTWVLRLGDGTAESHRRMQDGVDAVWPYLDELFDVSWVPPDLLAQGIAVDPASWRQEWREAVTDVLTRATLRVPSTPAGERPDAPSGGRHGRHTPALAEMLAEMQQLHRAHPGVTW